MNVIETERLTLRNFMKHDAEDLLKYLHTPRANCFLSEKLGSLDEAISEVEKRGASDHAIAVCLKSSGQLIGDMFYMKEDSDTYNVGWNYNGDFEGKGFATEAAKALFAYLFMDRHARRIYSYVQEDNARSQQLCERLGMRKEGLFKEYVSFVNDADGNPKYENTLQYAVLKKEWALLQQLPQD